MTDLENGIKLVTDDPKVAAEQVTEKAEEAVSTVSGELPGIVKPAEEEESEEIGSAPA